MTTSIAQNITTFLEDLKSADLVGISLLPQNLGLRLDFTFGPEAGDAKIELYRIVHLVLSQPLNIDDQDLCFWVGEVELKKIEESGSQILSGLSYPFKNPNGSIEADSSLIYFRLEGDIFVEVVCGNYKIFQEI
ncbi:hypothetical protein SD81_032205 [Tolypothrix campylonemoides VB511288]|nr:hypothetical protein SD81_032205 [Tolypothrix campylonemoides VB511288]